MKQILSIADSIENTMYSLQRCLDTFSDYNIEPLLAVPEFTDGDSSERTDIGEVLEYCFKPEVKLSAIFIGMIRDAEAVRKVAAKLLEHDHPAVVAEPLIISPDGKILVSSETYEAVIGSLMQNVHFLVLNIYEAELFSGIECHGPADTRRAAETICEKYNCVVFIGGNKKTGGRDLFTMGGKVKWYDGAAAGLGYGKKLFTAAVACELASDKSIQDAVTAARLYCGITSGTEEKVDQSVDYVPAKTETTRTTFVPAAHQPAAPKEETKPVVSTEPEAAPVAPVSSLVSPAKSIRDAARSLEQTPSRIKFGSGISIPSDGILARELAKSSPKGSLTAVTSGIEAPEPEADGLSKAGNSMIEDMREKLRRLSEM